MIQNFKNVEVICKTGTIPELPYLNIKKEILGNDYELTVAFIGPTEALALNKKYRNKTYTPNVLSFPVSEHSGELYICKSIARKKYTEFYDSYHKYLVLLVVHGCLHLKGDEHGSIMEDKEHELTEKYC